MVLASTWKRFDRTCALTGAGNGHWIQRVSGNHKGLYCYLQTEGGKYPTSAFPAAAANASRAADVLSVASPSNIAPGGFFDIDLTVAPNYTNAEQAVDHNLIYFDANNRVYVQQSSSKIVLRIGGADVLSSALTWSRETAIRVRAKHTARGRQLVITGATTGNGDTGTQSPSSAISLPATAYLLGISTGAEESSDLRDLFIYRP